MKTEMLASHLENKQIIVGTVVKGRQLGRKIGFPTANVDVNVDGVSKGVYGVLARVNDSVHLGIMNVGVKPTVGSNLQKTFEIHLLNFHQDIYGEELTGSILFKIRDEKKFDSIELLAKQIQEDLVYAKKRFQLVGLTSISEENAIVFKPLFKSS